MSRMNRVFALVGVMLMLSAGAASAFMEFNTPVRVATLAGGDAFNSNFISDSNDAYTWYGRIFRNADHVRVNWEGDGDAATSFGLIKSEEGYGAYLLNLQMGAYGVGGEMNHFTIGYGMPVGGLDWGAIYNRQNSSETNGSVEESWTYNIFGLGGTWDMDDDTVIDFTFRVALRDYYMVSGEEDDGDPDTDNYEYSEMGFAARAFRQLRDDVVAVPAFNFGTMTDTDPSGDEDKGTFIGLGVAFDYTVNEDNDLIVGASWQSSKWEEGASDPTTESKTTVMPGVFAAVEHEFTDMFTARMGASKNFTKDDNGESGDALEESSYYPFGFTFGMGMTMGDWVIDFELNQGWLYDFGYWIHGNSASDGPIAKIESKLWF